MSKPVAETIVKRRRREVAIGALVGAQLEKSASADAGLTGRLATQWSAVCPLLAPYCWPVSVKRGVLTIAVASDPVRQELHYVAPTIVEAANMIAGYEAVRTLRYERRVADLRKGGLSLVAKKPVARAEAVDMAKAACKGVADAELQEALTRLGAWLLDKK